MGLFGAGLAVLMCGGFVALLAARAARVANLLGVVMLALIFVGMANTFLRMTQGAVPTTNVPALRETPLALLSPIAMLACTLVLGLYVPRPLDDLCRDAQSFLEAPATAASAPIRAAASTIRSNLTAPPIHTAQRLPSPLP